MFNNAIQGVTSATVDSSPNASASTAAIPAFNDVLLNPGRVTLPLAPYLFVSITGSPSWQLNEKCLYQYLKTVVSGKDAKEPNDEAWLEFARSNHLMAGAFPLTRPHKWFLGNKRWITITRQSDWEIHLHFGFVNNPNEKHSHIELAQDTKHWLADLAGKATFWYKFITPNPVVAGDARIANFDTGIQIIPRQSFIRTLKSKESAASALGICAPCIGFLIKNYDPTKSILALGANIAIAAAVVIASTFFTAVIRHFFTLPRFSWAVEQLKD